MGVRFEMFAWGLPTLSPGRCILQLCPFELNSPLASCSFFPVLFFPGDDQSRKFLLNYWINTHCLFLFFSFFLSFFTAWKRLEGVCILFLRWSSISQISELLKVIYQERVCGIELCPDNQSAISCAYSAPYCWDGEWRERSPARLCREDWTH